MKRKFFWGALAASVAGLFIAACGDDDTFNPVADAGTFDTGTGADTGGNPTPDGGDGGGRCGDSTGAPPRLLLSMNNTTTSELVAYNIGTQTVDGRYTYPSSLGVTSSIGSDPYLLEQKSDVVALLDAKNPWNVLASWSVAGGVPDAAAGKSYSEPVAVIAPNCTKGYVARFERNEIAVIDTTVLGTGTAPTKFIDLSTLLQAGDEDGVVEVTSALYVASHKLLYVLLGNIDIKKVAVDGYTALCTTTAASITAIDIDKDQVVSLGGTGPGGSILLDGYSPSVGGVSFIYDAALDRFLVLETGCNLDTGGGVAGDVSRREIEEVQLATGQVRTLLPLSTSDFPTTFVYADATRAAVAFFGHASFWNPQESTLGADIPGGLDYPVYDGKGNLVGPRASFLTDGGAGPYQVVSVPFSDAGVVDAASVTILGENPFTDNTGFLGGAEIWPRP